MQPGLLWNYHAEVHKFSESGKIDFFLLWKVNSIRGLHACKVSPNLVLAQGSPAAKLTHIYIYIQYIYICRLLLNSFFWTLRHRKFDCLKLCQELNSTGGSPQISPTRSSAVMAEKRRAVALLRARPGVRGGRRQRTQIQDKRAWNRGSADTVCFLRVVRMFASRQRVSRRCHDHRLRPRRCSAEEN